jgi:hypothetical protein
MGKLTRRIEIVMPPLKHMRFWQKVHHECVVRAGQMDVRPTSQHHLRWDDEIPGLNLLLSLVHRSIFVSPIRFLVNASPPDSRQRPVSATFAFLISPILVILVSHATKSLDRVLSN